MELEAEENLDPQPPGHVHHHRRGRLRRQLSEAHRHPSPTVLSHQRDWPGRDVGAEQCRGAGTARLRDLRCVAAVARQARMLRSPKLQCESGRTARGSSRPRLRAPASGGHPSQSSTGRDRRVARACTGWKPDEGSSPVPVNNRVRTPISRCSARICLWS
jgi:hypothetical protein